MYIKVWWVRLLFSLFSAIEKIDNNVPSEFCTLCGKLGYLGSAELIDSFEQRGDAVLAIHAADQHLCLIQWHAKRSDEQRSPARASQKLRFDRRPLVSRFRHPDHRHPTLQRIPQSRPQPRFSLLPQPHKTINHDAIQRILDPLQNRQDAGELTQIKLPRQVFGDLLDLQDQFFNRCLALPRWEGHPSSGCVGVMVMDVDG